jgi:hypothetical protein
MKARFRWIEPGSETANRSLKKWDWQTARARIVVASNAAIARMVFERAAGPCS